ncbi:MAG: hypothetical protein ACOZNI_16970 [Myxococcota bacterium]
METEGKPLPRAPLVALLACTAIGVATGALWPTFWETDWSLVRRIGAGALLGAWCGLILTARRLLH